MRNKAMWLVAAAVLTGCGGNGTSAPDTAQPETSTGDIADAAGPDAPGGDHASDLARDSVDAQDIAVTPFPLDPAQRGLVELRGIIHLHSALSHDGCGPNGYEDFGGPDPECVAELRAAPCQTGIDFMMMTDHPGELKNHPYEEGLQHQEGDEIAKDDKGRPFANRIACPDDSLVPHAWVFYGTEGSKNMPVGLAGPDIPKEIYSTSYADSTPLEDAQAAVSMVHDLGGIALGVHTEEPDITAERIAAIPLDGMEIYNLHANLIGALESIDTLLKLDRFMVPGTDAPSPDLSLLLFLSEVSKDVEKFDWVSPRVHMVSVAATDIHRNVEVPALCPNGVEGSVCEGFAEEYPNFVAFAMKGGPLPLSDGERMDSYARSFRWFSNRFRGASGDPFDIREAVRTGRGYACFEVFGYPGGFDFYVVNGGKLMEMGDEGPLDGEAYAWFRTPNIEAPPWMDPAGIAFGMAQVKTHLVRATEEGIEIVTEVKGQGDVVSALLPGPGAYSLRIAVMPLHLKPRLPGVESLASKTYPYIYTNPVFLR
ncbi:MAG: hypothetical protein FJ109_02210 [Deltaproteobacteria bacterium]|nr:hypothetical protein [Deltaproteobacteria bacterium]